MNPEIILLTNGFFLSFLLLVLLIVLSFQKRDYPKIKSRVREDLKKIKEQITN